MRAHYVSRLQEFTGKSSDCDAEVQFRHMFGLQIALVLCYTYDSRYWPWVFLLKSEADDWVWLSQGSPFNFPTCRSSQASFSFSLSRETLLTRRKLQTVKYFSRRLLSFTRDSIGESDKPPRRHPISSDVTSVWRLVVAWSFGDLLKWWLRKSGYVSILIFWSKDRHRYKS